MWWVVLSGARGDTACSLSLPIYVSGSDHIPGSEIGNDSLSQCCLVTSRDVLVRYSKKNIAHDTELAIMLFFIAWQFFLFIVNILDVNYRFLM